MGSQKPKFNSGSSMLGKQPGNIEWEVNFVTYKQTYNPNRCFSEGLGGILSQNLALLTFHKIFSLKAADIQVDNTTPLSYLMKIGWAWKQEDDSSGQRNLENRSISEKHNYCRVSATEIQCESRE